MLYWIDGLRQGKAYEGQQAMLQWGQGHDVSLLDTLVAKKRQSGAVREGFVWSWLWDAGHTTENQKGAVFRAPRKGRISFNQIQWPPVAQREVQDGY